MSEIGKIDKICEMIILTLNIIKEQPTEASCSRGGNVLDSFKYLFYIIF